MVRSMFAGVAGLKSHQQKMDVIGNNIANVNTWGYKAYSFNFQDSIYSTSIRSSGGATNAGAYGGRNPSQVGYGASMASISFQYTTGAPSPTDNDLDCMIDGTGLFLVGGMVNGGINDIKSSGLMLTRVGLFTVDNNGYLVDANKNYVYGYALKDGTGIPEVPATALTGTGTFDIKSTGPDANGDYTIEIMGITAKTKSDDIMAQYNAWLKAATKSPDKNPDGTPVAGSEGKLYGFKISNNSPDQSIENTNKINLTITSTILGTGTAFPAEVTGNPPTDWKAEDPVDYEAAIPAEFEETLSPIQIPYDPKTGMQYNLQSYSISDTGVIVGIDLENRPITMGQLALIAVENPNGLEKTSGYYFNVGENAGDVEFVKPGEGPVGFIKSKFLEMPNVDLANEFSNMITTQRGFQANSKIITVTDEMLQELVNMKR